VINDIIWIAVKYLKIQDYFTQYLVRCIYLSRFLVEMCPKLEEKCVQKFSAETVFRRIDPWRMAGGRSCSSSGTCRALGTRTRVAAAEKNWTRCYKNIVTDYPCVLANAVVRAYVQCLSFKFTTPTLFLIWSGLADYRLENVHRTRTRTKPDLT
jgi:hypothetical protein